MFSCNCDTCQFVGTYKGLTRSIEALELEFNLHVNPIEQEFYESIQRGIDEYNECRKQALLQQNKTSARQRAAEHTRKQHEAREASIRIREEALRQVEAFSVDMEGATENVQAMDIVSEKVS